MHFEPHFPLLTIYNHFWSRILPTSFLWVYVIICFIVHIPLVCCHPDMNIYMHTKVLYPPKRRHALRFLFFCFLLISLLKPFSWFSLTCLGTKHYYFALSSSQYQYKLFHPFQKVWKFQKRAGKIWMLYLITFLVFVDRLCFASSEWVLFCFSFIKFALHIKRWSIWFILYLPTFIQYQVYFAY